MKIASIHLQNFKRFTDLKIEGIPPATKLVILLGPNGCGKSSVFDAMHLKSYEYGRIGKNIEGGYYFKTPSPNLPLDIVFHGAAETNLERAIYARTAYRNDPVMNVGAIQVMPSALKERRFDSMIQNDAAATSNFQRLASKALSRAFRREDRCKTLGWFQDETLGEIQDAMKRLFPDLVLNSLGDPLADRTFTFDKGTSSNFHYQNLSGGEKSAFDLLLDIFVKREEYNDTVFCIDEPEAHMNPRLQGRLLGELFRLMTGNSQLWIATHGIGMMREALSLYEKHNDQVMFLDFGDRNFDIPQVIRPTSPSREFWERTHQIILDDLAALVAPNLIILCESTHGSQGLDAECYNQIFSEEYPSAKFVSAGGKKELQNYIPVLEAITKGAKVLGLRDRDQATGQEVARMEGERIKVLQRGAIENYLLSDDVLMALCQKYALENSEEKTRELIRLRDENPPIKKAVHPVREKVRTWGVSAGETRDGFLRDICASFITPGMQTYSELEQIIFGE